MAEDLEQLLRTVHLQPDEPPSQVDTRLYPASNILAAADRAVGGGSIFTGAAGDRSASEGGGGGGPPNGVPHGGNSGGAVQFEFSTSDDEEPRHSGGAAGTVGAAVNSGSTTTSVRTQRRRRVRRERERGGDNINGASSVSPAPQPGLTPPTGKQLTTAVSGGSTASIAAMLKASNAAPFIPSGAGGFSPTGTGAAAGQRPLGVPTSGSAEDFLPQASSRRAPPAHLLVDPTTHNIPSTMNSGGSTVASSSTGGAAMAGPLNSLIAQLRHSGMPIPTQSSISTSTAGAGTGSAAFGGSFGGFGGGGSNNSSMTMGSAAASSVRPRDPSTVMTVTSGGASTLPSAQPAVGIMSASGVVHRTFTGIDNDVAEEVAARTLHLRFIPVTMSVGSFRHLLDSMGDVLRIRVCGTQKPDQNWTYGFVEFRTLEEANSAQKRLNLKQMAEYRLACSKARAPVTDLLAEDACGKQPCLWGVGRHDWLIRDLFTGLPPAGSAIPIGGSLPSLTPATPPPLTTSGTAIPPLGSNRASGGGNSPPASAAAGSSGSTPPARPKDSSPSSKTTTSFVVRGSGGDLDETAMLGSGNSFQVAASSGRLKGGATNDGKPPPNAWNRSGGNTPLLSAVTGGTPSTPPATSHHPLPSPNNSITGGASSASSPPHAILGEMIPLVIKAVALGQNFARERQQTHFYNGISELMTAMTISDRWKESLFSNHLSPLAGANPSGAGRASEDGTTSSRGTGEFALFTPDNLAVPSLVQLHDRFSCREARLLIRLVQVALHALHSTFNDVATVAEEIINESHHDEAPLLDPTEQHRLCVAVVASCGSNSGVTAQMVQTMFQAHHSFMVNHLATMGLVTEGFSKIISRCFYTMAQRRAAVWLKTNNENLDRALDEGTSFLKLQCPMLTGMPFAASLFSVMMAKLADGSVGDPSSTTLESRLPLFANRVFSRHVIGE